MDSEQYEYENDHGDRFHDYEEDSVEGQRSHWPADSANDYEEEEDTYSEYPDEDELVDDTHYEREDLGWDGGRED